MSCPLGEPLALGGTCDLCWTVSDCALWASAQAVALQRAEERRVRILAAAMAPREDPWAGYVEPPEQVQEPARTPVRRRATLSPGGSPTSCLSPTVSAPQLQLEAEDREVLEKPIEKGDTVRVVRGRKVPLGTTGVVFWLGDSEWGRRCGFKSVRGETHWTALQNVVRHVVAPMSYAEAQREAPSLLTSDTTSPGQPLTEELCRQAWNIPDVFEEA